MPDHPFWGPSVNGAELARIAAEDGQYIDEFDEDALLERTADDLAAGRIVGWMEGALEFGPRALGHRSLLAAPHDAAMRDRLNREIKYREQFRPFAPVVPIEAAERYFEFPAGGTRLGRFMSGVFPVRPEWRERLQAVTHVDGTARVQTIRQDQNERLYRLLREFDAITGVPVLLNTSFNVKGEPIVETPEDAIHCFLSTGIDYLVLHDILMAKKRAYRVLSPIIRSYSEVASLVRTTLNADIQTR